MFRRSVATLFVVVPLTVGCAAGEPTHRLSRDLDLAESERFTLDVEFIVEVTNAGSPVIADAVWLWDGREEAAEAHCMIHQGLGRCGTWFASMETEGAVTVFAEVCGELYSQPLAFAVGPATDSLAVSTHISIEADATHCGRTVPLACDNDELYPALEVTTVDEAGKPFAVREVMIESSAGGAATADCLEGVSARGCTEWASQHAKPGEYRAVVAYCGQTLYSDWVGVVSDDSGCRTISEALEFVVEPGSCRYDG